MESMNARLILKPKEHFRVIGGHQWIFSNEIQKIEGSPQKGSVVAAYSSDSIFLGLGFYNPSSLIAFRLISKKNELINDAFWHSKISNAINYRKEILGNIKYCRLVFGESDFLPGLVVDSFGDYLSVQFIGAGMDKIKNEITKILVDLLAPKGIVERNDSSLRKMEGLEQGVGIIYGTVPDRVEVIENKIKYSASILSGQKTGFYYDQRENRQVAASYCKGKRVLDCFCHSGAFALNALSAGATYAVAVDSSKDALEFCLQNAALNNMQENFAAEKADALELLMETAKSHSKPDVIMIDPPALIKSKKDFGPGYRHYVKLNSAAMKALNQGGILVTSSCSHNLPGSEFYKMLSEAASRSGKNAVLLHMGTQAKDHPILLNMPETHYLKFAVLKIC